MKLHRRIKHNEKVCRAHDLGSYAQDQGRSQVCRAQGNFGGICYILYHFLFSLFFIGHHMVIIFARTDLITGPDRNGHISAIFSADFNIFRCTQAD